MTEAYGEGAKNQPSYLDTTLPPHRPPPQHDPHPFHGSKAKFCESANKVRARGCQKSRMRAPLCCRVYFSIFRFSSGKTLDRPPFVFRSVISFVSADVNTTLWTSGLLSSGRLVNVINFCCDTVRNVTIFSQCNDPKVFILQLLVTT